MGEAMQYQQLITQEKILGFKEQNLRVEATLLPCHEDKDKFVLQVKCGELSGILAMAGKAEARTFSTPNSAWKITLKLGIVSLAIDNKLFMSEAA